MLTNITSTVEKTDFELIMYPNTNSWEVLVREHEIYTSFLCALSKSAISPKHCIECIIGASSTNRHLEESVVQILLKGDSYWSSKGQDDPNVPERIIFQLNSRVCIVNEIDIRACGGDLIFSVLNFFPSFTVIVIAFFLLVYRLNNPVLLVYVVL